MNGETTDTLRNGNSTGFDHIKENGGEETTAEPPKELIKSFGSYTTLHGFHFLIQSHSGFRRAIWMLLMLVCFVVLVIQARENYGKLKRYDSVVTTSLEHFTEMRFPTVTICNQNMLRKSAILGTDGQHYLDELDSLKRRRPSIFNLGQAKNRPPFSIETIVREAGHNLSTMLKTCSWRGQKCGPENFTVSLSFYRGLCYTFNSGDPGHPVLYVSSSGLSQSLSLMIDVQPDEYYGPYSYEATGLKLSIHEPGEFPDSENCADDVSPGQNTNVRITRSKFLYLEPPFTPSCGEKRLATTPKYRTKNCLWECYTRITVEACSCRYLAMPSAMSLNVSRDCTTEDLNNCVLPIIASYSPITCDCPLECENYRYTKQLSSAYFPSAHFWDTVFQLLNYKTNDSSTKTTLQEIVRQRIVKVNIFYESLSMEVVREKPAYDISDFASDMGGSMGLFLGCSLLTLCEFLDLLVIAFLMCFVKRR